MTNEEWFERIEHVPAGLAEQRRQDREEYRELWRETERQIQALTTKVADFVDASRAADTELRKPSDLLLAKLGIQIVRQTGSAIEFVHCLSDRL